MRKEQMEAWIEIYLFEEPTEDLLKIDPLCPTKIYAKQMCNAYFDYMDPQDIQHGID